MNLLGIHLQLMIGETIPLPAPLRVNEALESVEITHQDEGRSAFQLTFQIGRGPLDRMDYALLKSSLLNPFNRVSLNVFFGITPIPLMDGIITNHQLAPSDDPGSSKLVVTGEDITVMMDMEQEPREFPGLLENFIVAFVLHQYVPRYFLDHQLHIDGSRALRAPSPDERVSQKSNLTDLAFLNELARRNGFVFYIEPGPIPLTNSAYWGPPTRGGEPQKALSVNMGPNTNVNSINFRYNAMAPNKVTYAKRDGSQDVLSIPSIEGLAGNFSELKRRIFTSAPDGLDDVERQARAQGELDKSTHEAVTATGELDALRYGAVLKPRRLVGLRGAGRSYDGTYYVKSVTHRIDVLNGDYKQSFTLSRGGTGAQSEFVNG